MGRRRRASVDADRIDQTIRLKQEKQRADEADRILSSKVLNDALQSMRKQAHDLIEKSDPADKDGRERLYMFLLAVRKFEEQLALFVKKGQMAELRMGDNG